MSLLLEKNTIIVDQAVTITASQYSLYDESGAKIGFVQENMSNAKKVASLVVSKKLMPMDISIMDESNNVVASITRGIQLMLAKTSIKNASGQEIARINQKFTLLKPKFEIKNPQDKLIATIQGDITAWDFKITDAAGTEIGTVTKKFAGLKEVFSDADKYIVNINASVADINQRTAIIATAVIIDMILKENK